MAIPDTLHGVVSDSLYNRPIQSAEVTLWLDTINRPDVTALPLARAVTDEAGLFHMAGVQSGSYILQVRRLGYARRSLSIHVSSGSWDRITVWTVPVPVCLGSCPPDSALVSADRKRRHAWTCYIGNVDDIEAERLSWAGLLAVLDSVGERRILTRGGLPRDSMSIARLIWHVTSPKLCRRAGLAYDAHRAVTEPQFLVFKAGRLWLVQQNLGSAGIIFDNRFRYLTGFIEE